MAAKMNGIAQWRHSELQIQPSARHKTCKFCVVETSISNIFPLFLSVPSPFTNIWAKSLFRLETLQVFKGPLCNL